MIPQQRCTPWAFLACALCLIQPQSLATAVWADGQIQLVDTAVKKCVKTQLGSGSFLSKKSYSDRATADIFCDKTNGEMFIFRPPFEVGSWSMSKSLSQFLTCIQNKRDLPKGTLTGLYAWYQQVRVFFLKACSGRTSIDLSVQPEAENTLFDAQNFDPSRKFTLFVINGIVAAYFSGQSSVPKASDFFCKSGDSMSPSVNVRTMAEFQTLLASVEEMAPLLANLEKTLKKFNGKMDSDLVCRKINSAAYATLAKTKVTDCLLPFAALLMGDIEKLEHLEDPKKICEKKFYVFTTADLKSE